MRMKHILKISLIALAVILLIALVAGLLVLLAFGLGWILTRFLPLSGFEAALLGMLAFVAIFSLLGVLLGVILRPPFPSTDSFVETEEEDGSEVEMLLDWKERLDQSLQFPFQARVIDADQTSPVNVNQVVMVTAVAEVDDQRGVTVVIHTKGRDMEYPLCDLEVSDKKSHNFKLVDTYYSWFFNR